MSAIQIGPDKKFTLDGVDFVIDMRAGSRRPSDDTAFTLVKHEPYIQFYEGLKAVKPRSILELGIFQGGSYVFLDKLLAPDRMSAIEISPDPVEPLMAYIAEREHRHAHFGVSQSDGDALRQIVAEDLDGDLDMVVDDASHTYEHSRASFDILFPLLAPGGTYVVEDWAWAHSPGYQDENAPFAQRPALTNLLFEQIALLGSSPYIAEIRIRRPMYVVRKTMAQTPPDLDVWESVRTRGRPLTQI